MDLRYVMLFALLLVPMATAEGRFAYERGKWLDARMDNVVCKTNYMTGIIDYLMEIVGDTDDLAEHKVVLAQDVETLQEYADELNMAAFRAYLSDSYTPHLLEARQAAAEVRNNANLSTDQLEELRSDYEELRTEYQSCSSDSLARMASAKIAGYKTALEVAQVKVANLSARGVNTSSLSELIADARSEIVSPLQDAIDAAENASELRSALREYCLSDGCPDGANFHFAAKFETEKLNSILAFIKTDAEAASLGDEVESAQADIDAAKDILDSIGTSNYLDGQAEELRGNLASAATTIKEIFSSLRSE